MTCCCLVEMMLKLCIFTAFVVCIHMIHSEMSIESLSISNTSVGPLFGQIFVMRSDISELLSIYECVALSEINVSF